MRLLLELALEPCVSVVRTLFSSFTHLVIEHYFLKHGASKESGHSLGLLSNEGGSLRRQNRDVFDGGNSFRHQGARIV